MHRSLLLLVLAIAPVGCVAPTVSASLKVPQRTTTLHVFSCAEDSVRALHGDNELWLTDVSRRDRASGVFETGDFPQWNVAGFRIRVEHVQLSGVVEIKLKGAGAYFVDMGVEQAMHDLRAKLRRCLPVR